MRTHYEVLDLPPVATTSQIKARYKEVAFLHHPDQGGDADAFAEIATAAAVLLDDAQRAAYDAMLKLTMDPCPKCGGQGVTYVQLTFTLREQRRCVNCKGRGWYERTRA